MAGTISSSGKLEGYIVANGATNAQKGTLYGSFGTVTSDEEVGVLVGMEEGTSSIDSTTTSTIALTVQFDSSASDSNISMDHYIVESIQ